MVLSEKERLSRLLFYAYVLALTYLAYLILQPFLMPLAWAGVLALCVWPVFTRLQRRLGTNRAAVLVTFAAFFLLIAPAIWTVWSLVGQVGDAISSAQQALGRVENQEKLQQCWNWLQVRLPLPPFAELKDQLGVLVGKTTSGLTNQAAGIAQNTAIFAVKTVITFLALFFFLRDGHKAHGVLRRLLPFSVEQQDRLMAQTRELISAGISATLLIALLQGTVGGIVFACLGVHSPVFWGLVMVFCALIPVVGASVIWLPTAGVLFVDGHWIRGVILLLCGFGIIGMLDNILRPVLLRGKAQMNGLLMFLSILGGVAAFGFLGLVLGPVVMAAMQSLTALLAEREDVSSHP